MSVSLAVKLLTVAAFVVTLLYAQRRARADGLDAAVMRNAGCFAMLGAVYGGHLYAVLAGPGPLTFNALLSPLGGAKGVLGAFFGAALSGVAYLRCRRAPVRAYMESAIPAVALGYAVCRLGCFINGDDFGVISELPWAVGFGPDTVAYQVHLQRGWIGAQAAQSLAVHPTQLYHAVAALAWVFIVGRQNARWRGNVLSFSLFYYGVTRLLIQFYRDEHWQQGGLLDTAQWIGLLMVIAGIVLYMIDRHMFRAGKHDFSRNGYALK